MYAETEKKLGFVSNWNNKLNCDVFTTLRISPKYEIGQEYLVIFNVGKKSQVILGTIVIQCISRMVINNISEAMALIDTGYSKKECIEIIKTMNKGKNFDFDTQQISHITCKFTKRLAYIPLKEIKADGLEANY